MPGGDGTGPDGRSGCLTYGLPYGFFRNRRLLGRGWRGGRWRRIEYTPETNKYTPNTIKEEIKYLRQQEEIIRNRIEGLEKRLKDIEDGKTT